MSIPSPTHFPVKLILLYSWRVPHYVFVPLFSIIHSSVDGHLGCVDLLEAVSSHGDGHGWSWIFELDIVSFGYMPRNVIAGSWSRSIYLFLKNIHTDLHNWCIVYTPTKTECPPSTHPSQQLSFNFYLTHSDWDKI